MLSFGLGHLTWPNMSTVCVDFSRKCSRFVQRRGIVIPLIGNFVPLTCTLPNYLPLYVTIMFIGGRRCINWVTLCGHSAGEYCNLFGKPWHGQVHIHIILSASATSSVASS